MARRSCVLHEDCDAFDSRAKGTERGPRSAGEMTATKRIPDRATGQSKSTGPQKFRNEAALQRTILERLALVPRSLWMRNAQGGRTYRTGLGPGSADIIGVYNGQFVAIECKMPGEVLAPAQMAWSAWVTAAGGVTWVARSLQDIEALLARLEA